MAPLRYAAKFDPFFSLDCAPTPSTLAQSKERKGSNFAIWQPWQKVPDILHGVDWWTASLSLGHFRLSRKTEDPETTEKEGKTKRVRIDYWSLYVRR